LRHHYLATVGNENKQTVSNGLPVLSVKEVYLKNSRGAYYLNAIVVNTGGAAAINFIIEVCENSPDGNVVYSETVDSLESCGRIAIRRRIDKSGLVLNGSLKNIM
jgi:hypothetical protein